jgi:hypothetical protein
MKTTFNRRDFLKKSSIAGIACCGLLYHSDNSTARSLNTLLDDKETPDPKKLNYCGYQCPADCRFLKATKENNTELKKQAYTDWKIKEKYGVEFDPETAICWSCKAQDKPEGIVIKQCSVRKCAIEKGYDCCIQCKDLTECKKPLWDNFPDFKKTVIEMQKKYQAGISKG